MTFGFERSCVPPETCLRTTSGTRTTGWEPLVYRVRTINPDRFWRLIGGKCEGKIRQFFLLSINQLFCFLAFKCFNILTLRRHWRPLEEIEDHSKSFGN